MSYIDRTTRILAVLSHLAAVRTGSEGAVLHHALYATLLSVELRLAPAEADDRAADPAWSDAERRINDRARELIDQARCAIRKAEHHQDAWAPTPGDTVTWNGHNGTWIVRGWEDDDTVWIHRPDVRMVPVIGRSTLGMVDLAGWRDEPEHEELAAVAELRPAGGQADSTAASDRPAPEKVATIHRRPGLRPGSHVYAIAYTVDGEPAGGSLALPHDLAEWKADLAAGGWTVVEPPESQDDEQPATGTALTAGGAR